MLAHLYVDQMLITASLFLEAMEGTEEDQERVAQVASRQMRLISIGRHHWLDRAGGRGHVRGRTAP
jgi:hypothetical protein